MKFEPLHYKDPGGIYEDDPRTEEVRSRMERALMAKVAREVRRMMSVAGWRINQHGSCPESMTMPVAFHIIDDKGIKQLIDKAVSEERLSIINQIRARAG